MIRIVCEFLNIMLNIELPISN